MRLSFFLLDIYILGVATKQQDEWLDLCSENALLSPAAMASPDCLGHLMKLGHRATEWQRRFCLLKDACLYFYPDLSAASALGTTRLVLVLCLFT